MTDLGSVQSMLQMSTHIVDPTIVCRMPCHEFLGHHGCWSQLILYLQHLRIDSYILESDLHCREGQSQLIAQDTLLLGDKPNHHNARRRLRHSQILLVLLLGQVVDLFRRVLFFVKVVDLFQLLREENVTSYKCLLLNTTECDDNYNS